jgi:hypothetical protein
MTGWYIDPQSTVHQPPLDRFETHSFSEASVLRSFEDVTEESDSY